MYCLCIVSRLQPRAGLWLQLSSPHSESPPGITRKTNPLPANVSFGILIARGWQAPHTHTQRPLPLTSLNCPVCRRRYKTASSLKAHHTQNHPGEPFPPSLEEKVPVILPPPPNLQGKELAKPNPYCDFCLGDSTGNKKTSKPEKMVSCADCGRSGKWEGEKHGNEM